MATVILTWFDACYLQNILRSAEKDESIEIIDLTIKPATNKGDNYLSEIYRVAVEFSRVENGDKLLEKRSLILKLVPDDDSVEEMVMSAGLFDVEISMLHEMLPRMNKFIAKLSWPPLGARCLHVQYEKPIHIILDDLAPRGFQMAERKLGLNLEHSLLTIRNIGRFHAASIALKEKDPTILKKYQKGRYHRNMPTSFVDLNKLHLAGLAKESHHWPELNPGIADKLIKLSEVAYGKACELCLYTKDDFIVLNHGDCWINNMMFRYDEQQKPIDHIFVDFQLCYWGSPALDILHFIGSSSSYEVRFNYRDLILREYYSSLTDTMKALQCTTEAPSFKELQEILQKRTFFEVIASMIVLPFATTEKDACLDISEIMQPNINLNDFYGVLLKKILLRLFPLYDSMGLLDV